MEAVRHRKESRDVGLLRANFLGQFLLRESCAFALFLLAFTRLAILRFLSTRLVRNECDRRTKLQDN